MTSIKTLTNEWQEIADGDITCELRGAVVEIAIIKSNIVISPTDTETPYETRKKNGGWIEPVMTGEILYAKHFAPLNYEATLAFSRI